MSHSIIGCSCRVVPHPTMSPFQMGLNPVAGSQKFFPKFQKLFWKMVYMLLTLAILEYGTLPQDILNLSPISKMVAVMENGR